jgi:hypothetical protein
MAGLVALLFAMAGCAGSGAAASARPQPRASAPSPSRWPAGIAGGACLLLDYEQIEQVIGVSFDVSAAGDAVETFTCVLQQQGASLPDLTLAVTPTTIDSVVFKNTVTPKGATAVANLGRVAYSAVIAGGASAGPVVEVGWLAGNGRLMMLRFRFPTGTAAGDATALAPKLVELGKKIDLSSA